MGTAGAAVERCSGERSRDVDVLVADGIKIETRSVCQMIVRFRCSWRRFCDLKESRLKVSRVNVISKLIFGVWLSVLCVTHAAYAQEAGRADASVRPNVLFLAVDAPPPDDCLETPGICAVRAV